jgi:hypothetical protein
MNPVRPLYPRLLGDAARNLPPIVAGLHEVTNTVTAHGTGTVRHGDSRLARFVAWLLGFPAAGADRPLRVTIERDGDEEILSRHYPDSTLRTRQAAAGAPGSGLLAERFGLLDLRLLLHADGEGITFDLLDARWLGLRLPGAVRPRLQARESVAGGAYHFHVAIALPLIGRLIEYHGGLTVEGADPTLSAPLVVPFAMR